MEDPKGWQCRLCMGHDGFQLNIFREDLHHKQILMKLRTCLPVKVEHGDGLPSSICYKCLSQLEHSYDLWNKSFNSEAILRHNLARGRVQPNLKNESYCSNSALLSQEYSSSDHDTYFIETKKPQDKGLVGNEYLEECVPGKMKENMTYMPGKPTFYDLLENPYSCNMRNTSIAKETSTSTNKIHSEHSGVKYNDNCENKTYSAMNQPKVKGMNLDSGEIVQKGEKNYLRGTGTLWMDNEEFSDEEFIVKNKYIHKNLFGDDVVKMYSKLRKPQRKAKRPAGLLARSDKKDDSSGKGKTQLPWEKIHKASEEEVGKSPESGSSLNTFADSKTEVSRSKETHNIGGLQFDPNHCTKCNRTLTPSQNLLAHFQSHIQDS